MAESRELKQSGFAHEPKEIICGYCGEVATYICTFCNSTLCADCAKDLDCPIQF